MKKKISTRLVELKCEYEKGQGRLGILEEEMLNVKSSMLRISGAIQVLTELLDTEEKIGVSDQSSSGNGSIVEKVDSL